MGKPRCSRIARTPQAPFTYAKTRRRPPHSTQANTSKSNVLLSNSAQSTRGVLSFLRSLLASASSPALASSAPAGGNSYLEQPTGLQPWLYANGNPLGNTDPDGRRAKTSEEIEWEISYQKIANSKIAHFNTLSNWRQQLGGFRLGGLLDGAQDLAESEAIQNNVRVKNAAIERASDSEQVWSTDPSIRFIHDQEGHFIGELPAHPEYRTDRELYHDKMQSQKESLLNSPLSTAAIVSAELFDVSFENRHAMISLGSLVWDIGLPGLEGYQIHRFSKLARIESDKHELARNLIQRRGESSKDRRWIPLEVMFDENAAIAYRKWRAGEKLQHGEKLMLDRLTELGIDFPHAHLPDFVFDKAPGFELDNRATPSVSRSSPEYLELLGALERAAVGKKKANSEEDRMIVADAFFAPQRGTGRRVLATADKSIYNSLFREFRPAYRPEDEGLGDGLPWKTGGFEAIWKSSSGVIRSIVVLPLPTKPMPVHKPKSPSK